MIINHSLVTLIFTISWSFTQGNELDANNDLSRALLMDEAHLIVYNANYSNQIILFGNKVVCEKCNSEKLAVIAPNKNISLIINTKYAYNLEVRSSSSNTSSLCHLFSYKFDEHGTYLFHYIHDPSIEDRCFIEQKGNLSHYWTPVILGISFLILYTMVVQLMTRVDSRRCLNYLRTAIRHDHQDSIRLNSPQSINALDENRSSDRTLLPVDQPHLKRALPKRLRSLDTFRGFSLMIMIFVNYGGGGYWFFDHSIWNGLTLADLVFPWFTWMMGVSIVLSHRSLRSKNVRKRKALLKICQRTVILLLLGLSEQGGLMRFTNFRISGVLQRLATCYFFTALLVLISEKNDTQDPARASVGNIELGALFGLITLLYYDLDDHGQQSLRMELFRSIVRYWFQWLIVTAVVAIWILITFLLSVPGCPTGYLGPGGKHNHGQHWNCTGGCSSLKATCSSHLYNEPTCKEIYDTKVPYDPEGILGIFTGILLCYLGVQAGHSFVHSTRVHRLCLQWLLSSAICCCLGLGLSQGGHSDSWIPINKNLWSLTFVFTLAGLAFLILTILYLLVDVRQWFTGAPFLWLGMNSIAIYMCHGLFATGVPVQFDVSDTQAAQFAMHLYGAFFWSLIAGLMYYKKVFIAI